MFWASFDSPLITLDGFRSIDGLEPVSQDLLNASLASLNIDAKDVMFGSLAFDSVVRLPECPRLRTPIFDVQRTGT